MRKVGGGVIGFARGGDASVSDPGGGDRRFHGRKGANGQLRCRDAWSWTDYDRSGGACGDDGVGCVSLGIGGHAQCRPRAGKGRGPGEV